MNPTLLFAVTASNKRLLALAGAIMAVIVAMPMVAAFSVGQGTLAFLESTFAGSDTTNAISTTTVGLYEGPNITGDTYAWGNCTYWVYALRLKAGGPIPNGWGNASAWAASAEAEGYVVNHFPSVGAIMQISGVDNGLGHVAYVTSLDAASGDWTVSEMNVTGLDVVDLKTYPAAAAGDFNFIHDKGAP